MDERINPIKITDSKTGEVYELDFSRESVFFMDQRGFAVDESIFKFPATNIPKLFYYAFRKNHRKMSQAQTDAILKELGGLTDEMIERLVQLYIQAAASNNIQDREDLEKNPRMTVEM